MLQECWGGPGLCHIRLRKVLEDLSVGKDFLGEPDTSKCGAVGLSVAQRGYSVS